MSTNILDFNTQYKPDIIQISTINCLTSFAENPVKLNISSTFVSEYKNVTVSIVESNKRLMEVLKFINQQVGTGGSLLAIMAASMQTTGGALYGLKLPLATNNTVVNYDPELYSLETILSTIRSSLSLNMTEMAKIFRVERPTVYAWIGGTSEPHLSNKNRLHKIFSIAKYWEGLSSSPVDNLVRQPYRNGKSIVDLLSEEILDEKQILSSLQLLAENQGNLQNSQSKPSVRELVAKHKINIKESSDTIDWLTGKRIDVE